MNMLFFLLLFIPDDWDRLTKYALFMVFFFFKNLAVSVYITRGGFMSERF